LAWNVFARLSKGDQLAVASYVLHLELKGIRFAGMAGNDRPKQTQTDRA